MSDDWRKESNFHSREAKKKVRKAKKLIREAEWHTKQARRWKESKGKFVGAKT